MLTYIITSETTSNVPITIQQQIKDTTHHLDGATGSLYMYMCIFINPIYHNDILTSIHACVHMYFVCVSPAQRNMS